MCDICCSVNLSGAISPTVECVLLLSVWPQVGPDRRRLRLNSYGVPFFLSPTVVCVYITRDMATSKVGQTDTETRYVLYFAIVTCCVWYLLLSLRCPFPESKTRICHYYTCVLLSFLTLYLHRLFLLTYIYLYLSSLSTCASVRFLVLPALIIPLCAPTEISLCKFLTITRPLPTSSKVSQTTWQHLTNHYSI